MNSFKINDWVEIGIDAESFERRARQNSSTRTYIDHLVNGGMAKVISIDELSVRLKADELNESSNWFKQDWFVLANKKLNKIKRESQRL